MIYNIQFIVGKIFLEGKRDITFEIIIRLFYIWYAVCKIFA